VAEIKVQIKERPRKWPWVFLLLIPLIWFAMRGDKDEAGATTSDTTAATAATAATPAASTPAATKAPADSAGTKKPQP
jgi:hypothetical protein